MSSMDEYDKIRAALARLSEPGYVGEAVQTEEEIVRGLNVVQAMHGAPLTDLDGHPLDTSVDKSDEVQQTDAEYAAFQHAHQQQQFRPQQPATRPDDGLSDEGMVRASQGLSVQGKGLEDPDEGIDTTLVNETVRQGTGERRAQAEQEATEASTTYEVSDAVTDRLIGAAATARRSTSSLGRLQRACWPIWSAGFTKAVLPCWIATCPR